MTTTPHPSLAALGSSAGSLIAGHIDTLFRLVLRPRGAFIEPRFARVVTGEPHPFGNFALVRSPADADGVSAAIEPLLGCNAPSAVILTGEARPAVAARLQAAGFTPHAPMPAMGVEIDRLPETRLPEGCTLVRVAGTEADRWSEAFSTGYELPPAVGGLFRPEADADPSDRAAVQYFAIQKNGRIVCTSMLYLEDGVAGIYCVSTAPAERGKGLAAHATAEPLRRARALGYRVGILQSSEAGYTVYKRLGFSDFGGLPLLVRIPS